MTKSHILGYPRIGIDREMKKAVEAYWRNEISQSELEAVGKHIRETNWKIQRDAGLDFITVGDFSWYDHVLDSCILLGIIPERFNNKCNNALDIAFCMARGKSNGFEAQACEMTKWFNTNYHYIVPEFTEDQEFHVGNAPLFKAIEEAQALGYNIKPVLLGPLTLLWLGKTKGCEFDKLNLVGKLIKAYNQVFEQLQRYSIEWVQIDEPILTLDLNAEWQSAFTIVYNALKFGSFKCLLTTYFGGLSDNFSLVNQLPVHGLHIDICSDTNQLALILERLSKNKILSLGIINGRNIWRSNLTENLITLKAAKLILKDRLWLGSSCSLLHVPVDLDKETLLDEELKSWLAFAKQKVQEISIITRALNEGEEIVEEKLSENHSALELRHSSLRIHNPAVKKKIAKLTKEYEKRHSDYTVRSEKQREELQLPSFPTTTIGSFPQTSEIRAIRRDHKIGKIASSAYVEKIQQEIAQVIAQQEELNLDVLVHGEAERNDMVEYFGELLNGFAFTQNAWVQSYGSRCVKPPIIYGDISRTAPMTVEWSRYAQSLTKRPVKGMLTGPVTILAWSFERDDQAPEETALQIALALREEVIDLEAAGIKVIQIDEPAFRESLPLRKKDWKHYLDWAVRCFRIASSAVKDETQIHTHMCYSEFNDVIDAIAKLDADVITIECSRSQMELLSAFENFDYPNEIGPGIYDIHSPRVPTTEEMSLQLEKALRYIPISQLWVNPDCGLKTRDWPETIESLQNMVAAAQRLRSKYGKGKYYD